ncbi:MAG: hypothetical protein AAFY39_10915, partial [Pseudomonadota bacterium]
MELNASAPFPGAQENPMLLIGLPDRDITATGYFTLLGKQAVTFAKASPITLTGGDKLYRVYGGPARPKGGFWAPEPPKANTTQGEWRSTNAVEPSWNDGTHVVELTVNAGHALQCWMGEIESQPARNNVDKVIPDWWLVGGGTQYFAQFWTAGFSDAVTLTPQGGTPWADPRAVAAVASGPVTAVTCDAQAGDLNPDQPEQAHVGAVIALANVLRASAGAMQDSASEDAAALSMAANNLIQSANA